MPPLAGARTAATTDDFFGTGLTTMCPFGCGHGRGVVGRHPGGGLGGVWTMTDRFATAATENCERGVLERLSGHSVL